MNGLAEVPTHEGVIKPNVVTPIRGVKGNKLYLGLVCCLEDTFKLQ